MSKKPSKKQKPRNYTQHGNTTQVFRVLMCSMLNLSLNNGEEWFLFWEKYEYFQIKNSVRFVCSKEIFKNVRKVVIPIRKAISNLDLSLNKHFDQTHLVPCELISLIGLITENNSSSRNASQSTLTIAGLTVYKYKKETQKRGNAAKKVSVK